MRFENADMPLIEQIRALITSKKFSQSWIAKSIGVSDTQLSQWLGGKYPGDTGKLEKKIIAWLKLEAERAASPTLESKFVPTLNSIAVFDIARRCHRDNSICIVTGESGFGKSFSLMQYASENPDVILLKTFPGYNALVLISEINKILGVSYYGTLAPMLNETINGLKFTHRLIIVDEAEYLPIKALECLRRLHDLSGVGILLVGLPKLISNLRGKRGEFAQLYNRVSMHCNLHPFDLDDNKLILEGLLNGHLPKEPKAVVTEMSRLSSGCARRLVMIAKLAVQLAEENDCEINVEICHQAMSRIIT